CVLGFFCRDVANVSAYGFSKLVVDLVCLFFFNDTATTEIYTLSLHDALPISGAEVRPVPGTRQSVTEAALAAAGDRKSTRLNSSHRCISYAVFCLKKNKKPELNTLQAHKEEYYKLRQYSIYIAGEGVRV